MEYPNVMAPSPQEIYDGLKMIPNNPQGKQMLSGLVQQGQQTGSVEGGIAAALLNSYNQAQPVPQAPQGTVSQQVVAQAQPPMPQFDPNMLGLAAPGLEQAGQQQAAQRMATGGIVALAGGGMVRGFSDGTPGGLEVSEYDQPSWNLGDMAHRFADWSTTPLWGEKHSHPSLAQQEEEYYKGTEAPPSKRHELDKAAGRSGFSVMDAANSPYAEALGVGSLSLANPMRDRTEMDTAELFNPSKVLSHTEETPAAPKKESKKEAAPATTTAPATTETKAASPSIDEQIAAYQKVLGTSPDVAAELISQMHHEKLQREKTNVYENIASALGGYLSSYGSGQHRLGAGLAALMGTMGSHTKEEDKANEELRALQREQMMGPYQQRYNIASHILGQMEAAKAAGAKSASEIALKNLEGQYGLAKTGLAGEWDYKVRDLVNKGLLDQESLRGLIDQRKEQLKADLDSNKISASQYTDLLKSTAELEAMGIMSPEQRQQQYGRDVGMLRNAMGSGSAGLGGSGYTPLNNQGMYISGTPNQ